MTYDCNDEYIATVLYNMVCFHSNFVNKRQFFLRISFEVWSSINWHGPPRSIKWRGNTLLLVCLQSLGDKAWNTAGGDGFESRKEKIL